MAETRIQVLKAGCDRCSEGLEGVSVSAAAWAAEKKHICYGCYSLGHVFSSEFPFQ